MVVNIVVPGFIQSEISIIAQLDLTGIGILHLCHSEILDHFGLTVLGLLPTLFDLTDVVLSLFRDAGEFLH